MASALKIIEGAGLGASVGVFAPASSLLEKWVPGISVTSAFLGVAIAGGTLFFDNDKSLDKPEFYAAFGLVAGGLLLLGGEKLFSTLLIAGAIGLISVALWNRNRQNTNSN